MSDRELLRKDMVRYHSDYLNIELISVDDFISDVKEAAKEKASGAKEYVKETGSNIAEKGRGEFLAKRTFSHVWLKSSTLF